MRPPNYPYVGIFLSELLAIGRTRFTLDCDRCPRAGSYDIARLIRRFGDIVLPDVRFRLSADCQERAKVNGRCGCKTPHPLTVEEEARIMAGRTATGVPPS